MACTVDAPMCRAVKNVAYPRPQAVVAIDGVTRGVISLEINPLAASQPELI
jgi:hypothetical protein